MKTYLSLFGAVMSVASMVIALWMWQRSGWLIEFIEPDEPEVFLWAIRCLSVGLIAAAQMTIAALVFGLIYRRNRFDQILEWTAGGVFVVSVISAAALGLAGK